MFVTLLKTSRVHQWSKNSLLFVPLVLSHSVSVLFLSKMMVAFFAFSCLASAIYIMNDLMDKKSDQQHPIKQHRPIASGAISTSQALALMGIYIVLCVVLSLQFSLYFQLCLGLYAVLNVAYSWGLKRLPIIDLLLLATFYTIRIVIGGAAIHVDLTFWLLTFSIFWFLSLSTIKKLVDIHQTGKAASYDASSQSFLSHIGLSSGFASIIIACLYINNPHVNQLYSTPQFLWVCLVILLFWLLHIWYSLHLKKIDNDPVVFVLEDKISLIALVLLGVFGFLSV